MDVGGHFYMYVDPVTVVCNDESSELENHSLIHTEDRPFICTHEGCDKKYKRAHPMVVCFVMISYKALIHTI